MEPSKLAEWGKLIAAVLAVVGVVEYKTTAVKKEVADGVQKTRIADRAPAEYEMREMNARLFILEAALNKHFTIIRTARKHRKTQREVSLAEYALSANQAQILRNDLRSTVRDVLKEIDATPLLDE